MIPPKPKLLYISSNLAPQQIKFCEALQQYYRSNFWFYDRASRDRAGWWNIELGENCRVLERVYFRSGLLAGRYFAPSLALDLDALDPDILLLGGFSIPSNFFAYLWAKKRKKIVVVFTERSRTSAGVLRKQSLIWRLLRWLYRDVNMVMVSAEDAVSQFRDVFGFGDKVYAGRYASDLDSYLVHPLRQDFTQLTFLFANRLTDIYDPIKAIEVFSKIHKKRPNSLMLMNAVGELRRDCEIKISKLALMQSVQFLDSISNWEDLNKVYARSHILLLPAKFSNGNFSILEAMASGMGLVISDRILGIGKLVTDGENGFRCTPSIDDFAERIDRYIATPQIFIEHAQINRKLVAPLGASGTAEFFHKAISQIELRNE